MRKSNRVWDEMAHQLINKDRDLEYIANSKVEFIVLESDKAPKGATKKTCGRCVKVNEEDKWAIKADFLIIIYPRNIKEFTDKGFETLVKHELQHIGIKKNDDKEEYFIRPHDVEDFRNIIEEHGIDWRTEE